MSINRAPFNALVDDDGTNQVGTPWNKQAIKDVILDPVDAALASQGPVYAAGTWVPTVRGASVAGNHAYTLQSGVYVRIGSLVAVGFQVTTTPKDAAMAGVLMLGGLPFAGYGPIGAVMFTEFILDLPAGYTTVAGEQRSGDTDITLTTNGDAVTPTFVTAAHVMAGGVSLYGAGIYFTP